MKLWPRRRLAPAGPRDLPDEGRMTLVEHLTELRSRLVKAGIAVLIGGIVGWILYERIFDFLIEPYRETCETTQDSLIACGKLLVTDPLEGFSVRLKVTGYSAIAFAMPVILWQIWRFVTPGLYSHEKKYALPFVVSAAGLFALGAGIAYWTLPKALNFLQAIGGGDLVNQYSPAKYFQLITYMMLAFGIGFEFPILLIFLEMAGILSTERLRAWRRYAIVIVFVVVAVATPSADPISLFALAIPMCLFYEAAIVVGRLMKK